jgi:hypothetical protein
MAQLTLVKTLARLQEEQKHSEELLLDAFGLEMTRGSVVEIAGGPSTGKTSLAMAVLAQLTASGEICACVDATGSFDPRSAVLAGVELNDLLWIRCGGDVEKTFIAADYLVQAKGFGCIWMNLAGLPKDKLKMVPKTYWFRYRTRIKETPTIMLVTTGEHTTGSASHGDFVFEREKTAWSGTGKFKLLRELELTMRSRKGMYGDAFRARIEMDYSEV